MEEKKLVMYFKNSVGKKISIALSNPREDVTEQEIKTAMELIVAKNVFMPKSGDDNYALVSAESAKIVTTSEEEFDLVI